MSQTTSKDNIVAEAPGGTSPPLYSILTYPHPISIGDRQYLPRTAPNEASQGESGFIDSSGPIFSMYLDLAKEEDKKMVESWQADAKGILVFVRFHVLVHSLH